MRNAMGAAILVAASLFAEPVLAGEYNGWYLGAGIGYGYPMIATQSSTCTGQGGRIITQKGKMFCTKPLLQQQSATTAGAPQNPTGASLIHGQKTGFMWQGSNTAGSTGKTGSSTNNPATQGAGEPH